MCLCVPTSANESKLNQCFTNGDVVVTGHCVGECEVLNVWQRKYFKSPRAGRDWDQTTLQTTPLLVAPHPFRPLRRQMEAAKQRREQRMKRGDGNVRRSKRREGQTELSFSRTAAASRASICPSLSVSLFLCGPILNV